MEIASGKGEKGDVEKPGTETLRSRGHDGNGEDGEELKGRRWGVKAPDVNQRRTRDGSR